MFRITFLIFVLSLPLFALEPHTKKLNCIDTTHAYLSKKVENISILADDITFDTLNYTKNIFRDKNITQKTSINNNLAKQDQLNVDALFQNEKYMEETKKSFVMLSNDYSYNSLKSNDFNVKLTAKLALNKSRKNFKLYISGFNQDNINGLVNKDKYENSPEIGISYVTQLKENLETKYSIGIRSLYPYIKGRFSYTKKTNLWLIEPVQTVEYSTKDEFKEETKLYLDTEVINKVKFRLEFARGTSSGVDGMDYSSIASIFWTPQSKTGVQLSQGIYGNTKYKYMVDEVTKKSYSKINNFVTTLSFRQNIYKDWFFYELSPSVNFHKDHDFKSNYRFYIKLDMLFGKQ